MSGYLTSSQLRSVNKMIDWNVSYGSNPQKLVTKPIERTESLLTFRSGDKYSSAVNGGATPLATRIIERNSRELGDYGHIFNHTKIDMRTTHPRSVVATASGDYTGPLFLETSGMSTALPNSEKPELLGYSTSQLNVLGAGAIASAYPTKPQSDLLVAIAETLREGLPSDVFSAVAGYAGTSKRQMVGELAGDYLNLLFGVTPLVREIDKLIKTVEKVNTFISQLAADSGNLVRRSRVIEESVKTVKRSSTTTSPRLVFRDGVLNPFSPVPVTYYQTLETKVWFSGAFRYWIPGLQDQGTDFQSVKPGDYATSFDIARGVYGLRVTPKAAWNLLPFSWLVDWFVNVGVLFENADAMNQYGLVMPFGYVMAETKLTSTVTADFRNSSWKNLGYVASSTTATRQQRERATPYGFGLKDVDLNPIQLSILAALGLSTLRN